MTLEGLEQKLRVLNFEYCVEPDCDVLECRFHTGKGAVVQIIGSKPWQRAR